MVKLVGAVVSRQAVVVQRTVGGASRHYAGTLVQPQPHRAAHIALSAVHIGVQVAAVGSVPEAVIDQLGVFLGDPFLETGLLAGKGHSFQGAVGVVQQHGGRRFVHLAAFDAHQPVLDMVNAAHAVGAGQPVEVTNQVNAGHPFPVHGYGDAFLKAQFQIGGFVRGGGGIDRPFVGVLRRFRPGIFQFAGLGAASPQVFVGAVFAVGGRDGQATLAGVFHFVLPVHSPLADGGNQGHARRQGRDAHLNTHLVVALAGAAVGDRVGVVLPGHFGQAAGDERTPQRCRQRILPFIDGAGAQGRPEEFADQRGASVHGNGVGSAHGISPLADGFQIYHPQVYGAGDDIGVVILPQPRHGYGGVKAAGVGEDYFLAGHRMSISLNGHIPEWAYPCGDGQGGGGRYPARWRLLSGLATAPGQSAAG